MRVWDLPTRIFHWALAALVGGLVATGLAGGEWVPWHARCGYAVGTLLLFRLSWGVIGGHWSRFRAFAPSLPLAWAHVRGRALARAGHSPLGALSVYAMLLVLTLQVATGLCSEREEFAGPLSAYLSSDLVRAVTRYHRTLGEWLVLGLVLLHFAAIGFNEWRGKRLVRAMWTGNGPIPAGMPESRDGLRERIAAAVLVALCTLPFLVLARLSD